MADGSTTGPIKATEDDNPQKNLHKGNATLDSVDSELFSAMMTGNEQLIRSRFAANPDHRLSEAEMAILVQTRHMEEVNTYKALEEAEDKKHLLHEEEKAESEFIILSRFMERADQEESGEPKKDPYAVDDYGGHLDKDGNYYDRFGGHYDTTGYEFKDGSYTSITGDHFDAKTCKITDIHGCTRELPPGLDNAEDAKKVMKADAVISADDAKVKLQDPSKIDAAKAATAPGAAVPPGAPPPPTELQHETAVATVEILKEKGVAVTETNVRKHRAEGEKIACQRCSRHDHGSRWDNGQNLSAAPEAVAPSDPGAAPPSKKTTYPAPKPS